MAIYASNCSYAILEEMTGVKASWADRAGTVQPGLAGDSRQGRESFWTWDGQLHTFAAFSVFTFETGEVLENAVLSLIYILCMYNISGRDLQTQGVHCTREIPSMI